jgi:hypothetical protein
MRSKKALCLSLIATVVLLFFAPPMASASLCQTMTVSNDYPRQAGLNQVIAFTTTVAGSCTSDGEDYFAVRVDWVDNATNTVLTSNSTPIGYNANNFSVTVKNFAVSPSANQLWSLEANTYLIEAGSVSGKYLLNATIVTIQIGSNPLPEFRTDPILILSIALMSIALVSGCEFLESKVKHRTRTRNQHEVR